jgi:hypothetical protein
LQDEDHELISRYTQILSLSAIAKNDYNTNMGCYTNTTTFQFFRQRFTEPVDFVAFSTRRRDGQTTDGGYRHGEVKFSVPLQSKSFYPSCVDTELAAAITGALADDSVFAKRLLPALSFFNLANTDSYLIEPEAEVILIGSAFEQLFDGYGAKKLSEAVGHLLQPYASITVDQTKSCARPGIVIDQKYAVDQRGWPLHRKWAEELYHLRNAYIHGKSIESRSWGWTPLEHLIMGAFVFPLAVKLMLTADGHYKTVDDDEVRLRSIDELLAATGWGRRTGSNSNATMWRKILFDTKQDIVLSQAFYEAEKELKLRDQDTANAKAHPSGKFKRKRTR